MGRDHEKENMMNQHNIGKSNSYRFAQQVIGAEGMQNTLKQ